MSLWLVPAQTRGVRAVPENDYGSILVAGSLRGRLALPRGPWISSYVPGAEYRFVANASLQPSSLDVRAALRFYPWRGMLVALSGAFPVAERDRTDAAAFLSLGWIFSHDRAGPAMNRASR